MSVDTPAGSNTLDSSQEPVNCFHCGETVDDPARWQVDYDGKQHAVCCPGCQAAAATIIEAGLGEYYRYRDTPARLGALPDDLAERLDALAIYDEPEIRERYVHRPENSAANSTATTDLTIEGMRCGACVWLLEQTLLATPGVAAASVNFSTERAHVGFDPAQISLAGLLRRIDKLGYRALPYDADARELAIRRHSRALLQRLFLAGLGSMQVMMYALPSYLSPEGVEPAYRQLLHWASLVLTVPVILYSATPFLQGAWRGLKALRPGMDLPVAIGLVSAFLASVHSTITGSGEVYYDSVSMFVFLLLGARYLEWSARRRAMRVLDALGQAAPETARRFVDGGRTEQIPAMRLVAGDRIRVHAGERVPVDAVVLDSATAIDQSLLTGESLPITVAPGAMVPGGALLASSPATLRVLRPQAHSTLSMIERLIDRAAGEKPRLVTLADQVATVFVSLLLILAALVGVLWWQIEPERAGGIVIAVLVVSCPCALSLATPAALAAATGRLLRARLLITRGHALETLAAVTDVVFDKTGTLTEGRPAVTAVCATEGLSARTLLSLAERLERGSAHPFADALTNSLTASDITVHSQPVPNDPFARALLARSAPQIDSAPDLGVDNVQHVTGSGVIARLRDNSGDVLTVRLGSALWCGVEQSTVAARTASPRTERKPATSRIYLALEQRNCRAMLGYIDLADPIRSEASAVLAALKRSGHRVHLLSGDHSEAAHQVAEQLGLDSVQGNATPELKQRQVQAWQSQGAKLLMIGDGINDAPVLAAADVSLAVGRSTALARSAADCISLAPGLTAIPMLMQLARRTRRIVRQNLFWAFGYNITAIPLAALGWVPPWLAALGMATSSLLVSANALRLLHERSSFSA